jgi:hypothetical protein
MGDDRPTHLETITDSEGNVVDVVEVADDEPDERTWDSQGRPVNPHPG